MADMMSMMTPAAAAPAPKKARPPKKKAAKKKAAKKKAPPRRPRRRRPAKKAAKKKRREEGREEEGRQEDDEEEGRKEAPPRRRPPKKATKKKAAKKAAEEEGREEEGRQEGRRRPPPRGRPHQEEGRQEVVLPRHEVRHITAADEEQATPHASPVFIWRSRPRARLRRLTRQLLPSRRGGHGASAGSARRRPASDASPQRLAVTLPPGARGAATFAVALPSSTPTWRPAQPWSASPRGLARRALGALAFGARSLVMRSCCPALTLVCARPFQRAEVLRGHRRSARRSPAACRRAAPGSRTCGPAEPS